MRRGEIWTAAGGPTYLGKPGPVVIVQDDRFDATDSVTVCAFTTDPTEAPLFRLPIDPTATNGLSEPCSLMVDKITTMRRTNVGRIVGELSREDLIRLDRAAAVFLGLGG
jgi:mRNA interferase MazF